MKKISILMSNQGHKKISYLIEVSEIEMIALQKHLSGRRINKGSPLNLGLISFNKALSLIDLNVSTERLADLLNPRIDYKKKK